MDFNTFKNIIDNAYDEIFVYDNNYRVVYVNNACRRHYGYEPKDIIGKSFYDLTEEQWWNASVLPNVYFDKKVHAANQQTQIGTEIKTIAVPVFDKNENIEYVVMSVRDSINITSFNIEYKNDDSIPINKSIIYASVKMQNVMSMIEKIKDIDCSSILAGESGTGKTLMARCMHENSNRKNYPFINLNCASIPYELIESELFGYEKGAFTGANTQGHQGIFARANKGTILLDEISELPYGAQAKLLQVLQDKEFTPIGAKNPIKVDIKIIAATNKDLLELTKIDKFRLDLYYRLNIFEIYIPPLRKRKEDIEMLLYCFLNKFNKQYNKSCSISDNFISKLKNYDWPGNIRELKHLMERLVVMADDNVIDVKYLPNNIFKIVESTIKYDKMENDFEETMEYHEKNIIVNAYNKYKSSRKIASVLSISQTKAARLIKKHVEVKS